jgi:hypothetical protein
VKAAVLFCAGSVALLVVMAVIVGSVDRDRPSRYEPPPLPTLSPEQTKEQVKRRQIEEAKFIETKAGKIWAKHKNWDTDLCQVIADGKINYGMTKDQVRAAWGRPKNINTTEFPGSIHEQWVYSSSNVYFENGVMTAFQKSE